MEPVLLDSVFKEPPLAVGMSGEMEVASCYNPALRPVVEVVIEPDNGDEMEDEEEEEEEDIVITEMEGDGKVSAGSSLPESNGHVAEDKECDKQAKESTLRRLKRRLSESFVKKGRTPSPPSSEKSNSLKTKNRPRPISLSFSGGKNGMRRNTITSAPASATIGPSFFNSHPVKAFGSTGEISSHSTTLPPPGRRRYSTTLSPIGSPYGRLESYRKLEALGEGSYATVYKGISTHTGQMVALKEIRLNSEEGTPFTAIREASLLKGLKHANIVTLHDIIHTIDNLTFVFEYVNTDLSRYMEKNPGPMDPQNVKVLTLQLLRGLSFCHHRKILHRDLKPQNLLLNANGELKLADFGLARAKSVPTKTYSHEVVTLWYRPPDVLMGSIQYSTPLDMWGVGCIFVEMLTGRPLFPGIKGVTDQLNRIWGVMGTPSEATWPGISSYSEYAPDSYKDYSPRDLSSISPILHPSTRAGQLASQILQLVPSKRLLADDALASNYFSSLPPAVFTLPDGASVFLIPGVIFHR